MIATSDQVSYVYVTNGSSSTIQLRAGPAFGLWLCEGASVLVTRRLALFDRGLAPEGEVRVLVNCPATKAVADVIPLLTRWLNVCVLVDVTFPLTHPSAIRGAEARQLWSRRDVREASEQAIRAADGVITPYPRFDGALEWSDDLAALNSNCHIIPDSNRIGAEEFRSRLMDAWGEGARRKRRPTGDGFWDEQVVE